jgi:hypothetical protein
MTFETRKAWVIECRTGCSCCAEENHYRGYYATEADAKRQKARWLRGIDYPLASQYARYGSYNIEEREVEILPDGRCIDGYDDKVRKFDPVSVSDDDGIIISGEVWQDPSNSW